MEGVKRFFLTFGSTRIVTYQNIVQGHSESFPIYNIGSRHGISGGPSIKYGLSLGGVSTPCHGVDREFVRVPMLTSASLRMSIYREHFRIMDFL